MILFRHRAKKGAAKCPITPMFYGQTPEENLVALRTVLEWHRADLRWCVASTTIGTIALIVVALWDKSLLLLVPLVLAPFVVLPDLLYDRWFLSCLRKAIHKLENGEDVDLDDVWV